MADELLSSWQNFLHQTRQDRKTVGFDVVLHDEIIDTVFYIEGYDTEEIRRSLVEHDEYSPQIIVKEAE